GSLHEDLNIDDTRVGVYMEHFTTGATFQRIWIGANTGRGLHCEWADPSWGGRPACNNNVIQDATILSYHCGVYLDQGTTGVTIRRVRFSGQGWAAIGDYLGVNNTYYGNDYTGILPGALQI